MALHLTENNQLYLYQLFSRELGMGKQTFITRVEEVLAADDLSPLDMGAATVRELLEGLESFIELKVFKGGRVYAIVRPRDDWDAALARAGKPATKQAKGKPWKRTKNALKPVKPKRSKERLEAERRAAEAAAEEERRKTERAQAKAAVAEAATSAKGANITQTEGPASTEGATDGPAAPKSPAASTADEKDAAEAPAPKPGAAPAADSQPAMETSTAARAEPVLFSPAKEPTGVAVQSAPAETAEGDVAGGAAPKGEKGAGDAPRAAHSGISLTITYDPGQDEPPAQSKDADPTAAKPLAAASAPQRAAQRPQADRRRTASVSETVDAANDASAVASAAAAADTASDAGSSANEPVLFMPPEPAPRAPEPARAHVAGGNARTDYPVSISDEVYCRNAPLSMLTRILPYGIDLMTVLDEDWRVARATGTAQGTRNRVTFPLRYLQEDGSAPVEVTLKRSQRPGTGARWELALVDGDDGTGTGHEAASLEGLPQADEGAWSDLDAAAATGVLESPYSPVRVFAQQMSIGSWDALLGELARMALPERWSTQVKPQGNARYNVLREYLAVTFAWVARRNMVEQSADGGFAAFNTGLLDSAYEDICLCLEATGADIPWRFIGFATAGNGALGRRMVAELPRVPQAPRYVTVLDDIVPDPSALLVMDYHTLLGPCLGRLPRGFLTEMLSGEPGVEELLAQVFGEETPPTDRRSALEQLSRRIDGAAALRRRMCRALDDAAAAAVRRCQRSYRTAVPVYDPRADRMKLLLPLCLVDDRTADCALVLERQPSGAYQAASVLTPPRAYACARVVCADMPAWLAPSRALG